MRIMGMRRREHQRHNTCSSRTTITNATTSSPGNIIFLLLLSAALLVVTSTTTVIALEEKKGQPQHSSSPLLRRRMDDEFVPSGNRLYQYSLEDFPKATNWCVWQGLPRTDATIDGTCGGFMRNIAGICYFPCPHGYDRKGLECRRRTQGCPFGWHGVASYGLCCKDLNSCAQATFGHAEGRRMGYDGDQLYNYYFCPSENP